MRDEEIIIAGLRSLLPEIDGAGLRIRSLSSGLFPVYLVTGPRTAPLVAKGVQSVQMARAERKGLQALAAAGVNVPQSPGHHSEAGKCYLFLEYIERGRGADAHQSLIANLKRLYARESLHWGWTEDNFIGSLVQPNRLYSTFTKFWWSVRLEPMLQLAVKRRLLDSREISLFERVVERCSAEWSLDQIRPRLIHGDLWSGNVLSGDRGVVLIDPSVAYAHPEQDLAMLDLFGSILTADDRGEILNEIGMAEGYEERKHFWQIYPLLVHVNLFGAGYLGSLRSALARYS